MQYIDKSTHRNEGHQIIDSFLESSWIAEDEQYINRSYNDLKKINEDNQTTYSSSLKSTILQNQNNYCCYCMKKISDANTTLEHIIPHKTTTLDEFDQYIGIGFVELDRYVIFRVNFDRFIYRATHTQYPHDIAYDNLVASCNSNVHCNHERKSKFLKPLFYDRDIQNKVSYDQQGRAYSKEYCDELGVLGLDNTEDLRLYRKIWYELSLCKNTLDEISDEDIEEIVLNFIANSDSRFEKQLNNFIGTPSKKDDLIQYKWFFEYFKASI